MAEWILAVASVFQLLMIGVFTFISLKTKNELLTAISGVQDWVRKELQCYMSKELCGYKHRETVIRVDKLEEGPR